MASLLVKVGHKVFYVPDRQIIKKRRTLDFYKIGCFEVKGGKFPWELKMTKNSFLTFGAKIQILVLFRSPFFYVLERFLRVTTHRFFVCQL